MRFLPANDAVPALGEPSAFVAFRRVLPGLCQPIVNQKPDWADAAAQDTVLALLERREHRLRVVDEQAVVCSC